MFDYTDDIHFVSLQLNHYYGFSNWPWRLCGEIVGVSASTVRKYYNQEWLCDSKEKVDAIQNAINNLDYSNFEVKKLTLQTGQYFLKEGKQVDFVPFKKETPLEEKIIYDKLSTKYNIDGGIKIKWPEKPGLYLFCQIVSPCHRPKEKFYIIKVGKSQNLNKRIQSYNGMNPFATCIDVKLLPSKDVDMMETKYHMQLNKKYLRQGGTEWFIVPEEDYINILNLGFNAF